MTHDRIMNLSAYLRSLPGRRLELLLLVLLFGGAMAQPSFNDVQAIFEERCIVCHSGSGAPLGLQLDTFENVMAGSDRMPVVVPGDPEASELVHRIRGTSLPRMPLTGPPFLDEAQIDLIVEWIAAGAEAPDSQAAADEATDATTEAEGAEGGQGADDRADGEGARQPAEAESQGDSASDGSPTYSEVEPILLQRCVECHADGGLLGAPPEGLRLSSYELTLQGGERVVVVPFSPLASELYRKVVGHSLPRMPLDGPPYLSEEEIARIGEWIASGAPDATGEPAPVPVGGEVRLRGTLTGRWELDGLELQVSGSTRLDDDPGVGDYVEVRGSVGLDGEIRVERPRTR